MRNGVLLHPGTARDGRCLILPHPRTQVPTYYLYSENAPKPSSASSDTSKGELFELSTLKDTKYDRSWMISGVNEVISSGQLEILSRVDVRFLVTSLLYSVLVDSKFRSLEDIFEQIALGLHGKRKEEMIDSIVALKSDLGEGEGGDGKGSVQQEWTDIVTFGNLPIVKDALQEVADVQGKLLHTLLLSPLPRKSLTDASILSFCQSRLAKRRTSISDLNLKSLPHSRRQTRATFTAIYLCCITKHTRPQL